MTRLTVVSATTKLGRSSLKTIAFTAGLSLALAQIAQATPIVLYDLGYNGATLSLAPNSVATDVTAQDLSGGDGTANGLTGNPSHGWYALNASMGGLGEAGAVSANECFEFTVTPAAGYALDLTSLTFNAGEFASGENMFVRSSVDGYTSDLLNVALTSTTLTQQDVSLDSAFSDLADQVTFHVYGYGTASYVMNFNDVSLNGTVLTVVPEPGTLGLIGGGMFALFGWRRRKA